MKNPPAVELVLFDNPMSPYARKVRIALCEKEASFEVRSIERKAEREDLQRVNPRVEVPTLLVGDEAVADSTVVCELLEDLFPEPALLPRDPLARAAARAVERFCDEQLDTLQFFASLEGRVGPLPGLGAPLVRRLDAPRAACFGALEAALRSRSHLVGDALTIADVAAVAQLLAIRFLGLGPEAEHPRLCAWLARMEARASVRRVAAEATEAFARAAQLGAEALFAPPIAFRGARVEAAVRLGLGPWLLGELQSGRAFLSPSAGHPESASPALSSS